MDHVKKQSGGSASSSSFTENLFGPKDAPSASSSGLFSSVFGPSSTGLRRDSSHSKNTGSSKKHEFGGPYGSGKPSPPAEYKTHNEAAEASYFSSSIYYGGQDVYSPNTLKKDGGDTDPNGGTASRGNWWQGSLYY